MNRKEWFNVLKIFIFINFSISLIINSLYIFVNKFNFYEFIFLVIVAISNTFWLYLPLFFLSLVLSYLGFFRYLIVIVFAVFHLLNIIDLVIYKFWGFHINSMVLNIIFTPGGIESLNQSWNVKAYVLFFAFIFLFIEIFSLRLAVKISRALKFNFYRVVFLVFSFFIVDKLTFAFSSVFDWVSILKTRDVFPLYQPLTVRRFVKKYFGFEVKREEFELNTTKSRFNYPKSGIKINSKLKNYNIVFIVIDSLRYDMLNKDVMPNLWEFSKKSVVFDNHYSGGNATRFGIFSMIYGIWGNYWFKALEERKSPVLIDVLIRKNYDVRIFSSSKLTFPEFDKTCFLKVKSSNIYDNPPNADGATRDIYTTKNVLDYLSNFKKPFFLFVFYDASHGSYDYPKEFEKFVPSHGVNLLKLNKNNVEPLFNKYKNSIHFQDYLIGKLLKGLSNELKNTIVIITGDHGEPFFEKGYYGHNNSYCEEEIKVPLVFYHPYIKHKIINYKTSHYDIPATLTKILGVENKLDDYTQGFFLFEEAKRDFIPVFSWSNAGLVFDDYTVVLPLSTYASRVRIYRNSDWSEIDRSKIVLKNYFSDFVKGTKIFYQ